MHQQLHYQLVLREPVRRRAEMATLLVPCCVSVWGRGSSPAPAISCVCQIELKNNNRLTSRLTRPRSSYSSDISEL